MIELVLIVLFAWRIYHMALEKGLSAWRWVTNFLSGYFAFGILISVALVVVYGKEVPVSDQLHTTRPETLFINQYKSPLEEISKIKTFEYPEYYDQVGV